MSLPSSRFVVSSFEIISREVATFLARVRPVAPEKCSERSLDGQLVAIEFGEGAWVRLMIGW